MTSIDLTRNRSAAEIVRSTLSLYGAYPWLFLFLAFVVMAPWDLAKLAVTGIGPLGDAVMSVSWSGNRSACSICCSSAR